MGGGGLREDWEQVKLIAGVAARTCTGLAGECCQETTQDITIPPATQAKQFFDLHTVCISIQMRRVSMAFCFVFFVFVVVVVLRFNQHRAAYTYPGLHIKFKNSYNN